MRVELDGNRGKGKSACEKALSVVDPALLGACETGA